MTKTGDFFFKLIIFEKDYCAETAITTREYVNKSKSLRNLSVLIYLFISHYNRRFDYKNCSNCKAYKFLALKPDDKAPVVIDDDFRRFIHIHNHLFYSFFFLSQKPSHRQINNVKKKNWIIHNSKKQKQKHSAIKKKKKNKKDNGWSN